MLQPLYTFYSFLTESFLLLGPRDTAYVDPKVEVNLSGKVIIVTGGASGCGYETAKELLARHAKVYIASRNEKTSLEAIEELKADVLKTNPKIESKDDIDVHFLKLDLADLTTIEGSAKEFLSKETRLDILINNAGVMLPPEGSVTTQGYDLQFGTNVLGHYAFTELLLDLIKKTAAESKDKNYNRVIFTTSCAIHTAPKGYINFNEEGQIVFPSGNMDLYSISKAGDLFLATSLNRRLVKAGIRVVGVHPGSINTSLKRHMGNFVMKLVEYLTFPKECGSINLMYAALSDKIVGGEYIVPWSYVGTPRPESKDIQLEQKVITWVREQCSKFVNLP